MPKKAVIAVVVAIILLVGGVFVYKTWQGRQLAQQSAQNQPVAQDETANWKVYRNEKYGFEFKYPPAFGVNQYSKIRVEDYKENPGGPGDFYFRLAKSYWEDSLKAKNSYKTGDKCPVDSEAVSYDPKDIDCVIFSLHPYAFKFVRPDSIRFVITTGEYEIHILDYDSVISDEIFAKILSSFRAIK